MPDHSGLDGFEFERDFGQLGRRTIQINALPLREESGTRKMVLVAIKDITERREAEQEKQRLLEHTEELLEQQTTLLREMRHRIANSLQIIASILLLKAGSVTSEETKQELRAAHQRVMSVAAVQSHLQASEGIEQIEIGPYLTKLSAGLASSMVGPKQAIEIDVIGRRRHTADQPCGQPRPDRHRIDHERDQICLPQAACVGAYPGDVRKSGGGLEADGRRQWRRPPAAEELRPQLGWAPPSSRRWRNSWRPQSQRPRPRRA